MNIASGLVTFLVIWWMLFLMSLPFGVQREEAPESGHEPGAPKQTHLRLKVLIVSILAAILWGIVYYLVDQEYFMFDPQSF